MLLPFPYEPDKPANDRVSHHDDGQSPPPRPTVFSRTSPPPRTMRPGRSRASTSADPPSIAIVGVTTAEGCSPPSLYASWCRRAQTKTYLCEGIVIDPGFRLFQNRQQKRAFLSLARRCSVERRLERVGRFSWVHPRWSVTPQRSVLFTEIWYDTVAVRRTIEIPFRVGG